MYVFTRTCSLIVHTVDVVNTQTDTHTNTCTHTHTHSLTHSLTSVGLQLLFGFVLVIWDGEIEGERMLLVAVCGVSE